MDGRGRLNLTEEILPIGVPRTSDVGAYFYMMLAKRTGKKSRRKMKPVIKIWIVYPAFLVIVFILNSLIAHVVDIDCFSDYERYELSRDKECMDGEFQSYGEWKAENDRRLESNDNWLGEEAKSMFDWSGE